MNANDAYQIARHVKAVFPKAVPKPIGDPAKFAGPNGPTSITTLKFDTHPGALIDPASVAPPSWFERNLLWLAPLVGSILLSLITEWTPSLVNWLDRHRPSAPPPPSELPAPLPSPAGLPRDDVAKRPPEFVEIDADIGRILKEMHDSADDLIPAKLLPAKSTLDQWRQQIGRVYQRIHAARQAGKLDIAQAVDLKAQAFQLQQELDFLRDPPWLGAAARPRRTPRSKKPGGDRARPDAKSDDDITT
jgi:hypothetical protein